MSPVRGLASLFVCCAPLLLASPALGQNVMLTNARLTPDGEPVTIMVVRGKIRAIRRGAAPPRARRVLDLGGKLVVPGRIDTWAEVPAANTTGKASDEFDTFDDQRIRAALAQGVTTVVLTPRRGQGLAGLASVVKLKPGVRRLAGVEVAAEAMLCVGMGDLGASPSSRVGAWSSVDRALAGARRYQITWSNYREALVDYEKKLSDLAEVESKSKAKGKGKSKGKAPAKKPAPKKPAKPDPKKSAKPAAKKDDKKNDKEPKKPTEPRRKPTNDLLVKALEGKLPVRVEAHRAADILNALEVAERYGLRLVIDGGSEAHLVAQQLAEAEVPVILGPTVVVRPPGGQPSEQAGGRIRGGWQARTPARVSPTNAAKLHEAGVTVLIGSGSWSRTPFVELNAAAAVGHGLSPEAAVAGLTSQAAEVLGLGKRLGRIAVGADADLVVLGQGGGPLATAPNVEMVFVDGRRVYAKESAK